MPPRGLKMRNRGCFGMYLIIYKKGDQIGYIQSLRSNWEDTLCDFIYIVGEQKDEKILDVFKKTISNLSLPEAIQLMYFLNGDKVKIVDIFANARQVDFGQTSLDPDDSNAPS